MRGRGLLMLAGMVSLAVPAHADWKTGIYPQADGSSLAVMQGTAQYDFALFLYCRDDGEKHVILRWGKSATPVAELKPAPDLAFTITTDAGAAHTATGLWADYGGPGDLLEYSNFFETDDIVRDIGQAKDIVTFIYDSPALKVHEGAVAFADGAAEAAQKFLAFCTK
jgi:hypothetical protein